MITEENKGKGEESVQKLDLNNQFMNENMNKVEYSDSPADTLMLIITNILINGQNHSNRS